jgi:hypothetical protein
MLNKQIKFLEAVNGKIKVSVVLLLELQEQ